MLFALDPAAAMLFFAFEEATFGKNANDRFREYLAAKKADADKLAADQKAQAGKEAAEKKAADDQIKLEKEKGARLNGEYKAQFRSADQTYKDMQLAILKAGDQSAAAAQIAQVNRAAAEKRKPKPSPTPTTGSSARGRARGWPRSWPTTSRWSAPSPG